MATSGQQRPAPMAEPLLVASEVTSMNLNLNLNPNPNPNLNLNPNPNPNPKNPPCRILAVGDGDMTLSLALKRAYGKCIDLTASTLDSKTDLMRTYPDVKLEELEESGVSVLYQVDATQIHAQKETKHGKWDTILFHHPHLGLSTLKEDEAKHAQRHYILLCHYLSSARSVLAEHGLIHVCLCGTQHETWRLMQAAQHQGLQLVRKVPTAAAFHQIWIEEEESSFDSSSYQHQVLPAQPGHAAPRRYRNGKLGSKHFLGKYGYRHRRTEGGNYAGNANDMNVSGSMHFVFGIDLGATRSTSYSMENTATWPHHCGICQCNFRSDDELQKHARAPALPKVEPTTYNHATATVVIVDECQKSENPSQPKNHPQIATAPKETTGSDEPAHTQPIEAATGMPSTASPGVVTAADATTDGTQHEMVVDAGHHGKRLRWYLRQEIKSLSKRQSDECINSSLVLVNGKIALDSSRILATGDSVILQEPAEGKTVNTSTIDIVRRLAKHHVLVAWKNAAMRTKGMFGNTLEYAVSQQEGLHYSSLSKLDTACPGFCVLELEQQQQNSPEERARPNIQHVVTVLVHSRVPDTWCQPFTASLSIKKQWKRKREDDNPQDLVEEIKVVCTEQTSSLSTLSIFNSNGAGNSICAYLRKQGFPVVGDQFCRQEYLSLKRSIRNRLKGKLCMGCYQLQILLQDGDVVVSKELPDKLSACYWENFSSSPHGNTTESGDILVQQL
jgi:hypothetical protein